MKYVKFESYKYLSDQYIKLLDIQESQNKTINNLRKEIKDLKEDKKEC